MAKKTVTILSADIEALSATPENEMPKRDYKIMEASLKDGFCDYTYEITSGIGLGNKHGVKGKAGIVKDSLRKAYEVLNVHLAFIDDVFKHSGIEVDDIDTMKGDDLTFLFAVTGFKIKGSDENESVALIGSKYASVGGRFALESPRISISDGSSYKWYNELTTAIKRLREEVALYHEGNYDPVELEDAPEDKAQTKIKFDEPSDGIYDVEFENSEV